MLQQDTTSHPAPDTRTTPPGSRTGGTAAIAICHLDNYHYASTHEQLELDMARVAEVITAVIAPDDACKAIDPGTFMIELRHVDSVDAAVEVAGAIRRNVAEPAHLAHGRGRLTVSIGVTERLEGEWLEHGRPRAERAMDYARRAGGNRVYALAP
jgi:GGDEF domain-containing protein